MIPRFGTAWVDLVRSLGEALLEVLRAEADVIGQELGETGKQAGIGMALLAAAAMVLFWFLGVLTLFMVAVLTLLMPTWAAAATVCAVLLAIAVVLAALGWLRFDRLESPSRTVRRRWQDHQAWWNSQVLATQESLEPESFPAAEEVAELPEPGSEDQE